MTTVIKHLNNFAVRTAMTLFLAVLTTSAWAMDFITEVKVIGGTQTQVNELKNTYISQGWTFVNKDLNAGCGGTSDYIYLLYKRADCQGLNTNAYITDFYISNADGTAPNTLSFNGISYTLAGYDGSSHFKSTKGDLNSNTRGANIHIYYTRTPFADRRAVTQISFDSSADGAVGVNGGTSGYDLNTGTSGNAIYMHFATTTALPVLQGSGTTSSPFLISNADEWFSFVAIVYQGSYSSGHFKLTDNIPTATDFAEGKTALTTMAGTSSKPFKGHFHGNGKTITVNISSNAGFSAPFSHVNGATIEDLTVNGSVACSGSSNHGAGLVGSCDGGTTVISGCTVAADVSGSGYVGGIVGHGRSNTLNISNSVFSGTVSGFGNFAGGLVGWCDALTMTVTNCLFKGSFQPASGGLFHPIACKNGDSNATAALTSTYYLKETVPTAGVNNLVLHGYGKPVSSTCIDGEYDIPVTAADGIIYYMKKPEVPTEIINEAPEGVEVIYDRSGGAYSNNAIQQGGQVGLNTIVFTSDNKVFFPDPLSQVTLGTYLLGELDGNKITVQLPQTIFNTEEGYSLEVAWVNITDGNPLTYSVDRATTVATFTIDGNTIRLDGSSQNHVLGAVWDDDTWYGAGDYGTVYTELNLEDLIIPPSSIIPVTYDYSGSIFSGTVYHDFSTTVRVVKDGNDVYINGLASSHDNKLILPEAWAKGTLNGNTLTIPKGQFMGIWDNTLIYLIGYDNGSVTDITFSYNAENETFTLNKYLSVNAKKDELLSICYTEPDAIINNPSELITLPQNTIVEDDWVIEGTFIARMSNYDVSKSAQVAFCGNDVYIKGIARYFPDAWLKGTISGNTATFISGQFVGEDEYGKEFMVGHDGTDIVNIVFNYDTQERKFTLNTPYLLENQTPDTCDDPWGYYTDLVVYEGELIIPEQPKVVEIPEGLETEPYLWTAKEDINNNITNICKFIHIGFDGNDVYVQGLCKLTPARWIKGTINGNTATFATGQYFGIIDPYNVPVYMIGIDNSNNAICDVVCSFNTTTKSFTTDTKIVFTDEPDDITKGFHYYYSDNVWSRINDVAGIPANPSFKDVNLTSPYPSVQLNIPVVDVEGNGMYIDKLYYRLYSDIERNIQQISFSPDDYFYISETLVDIPYTFDDNYDIYQGGIRVYLYQDNVSEFNRIGVQSIYYGGDVCNMSDVVWYEIKDYTPSTDIFVHDGNGVKSLRYYNAAGMPCEKPTTNGLYIIMKEMEDGTVKVEKRNH